MTPFPTMHELFSVGWGTPDLREGIAQWFARRRGAPGVDPAGVLLVALGGQALDVVEEGSDTTRKVNLPEGLAHHMVVFGPRYRELVTEIFGGPALPPDYSLYLHSPCLTDPSMAPPGQSTHYVLAPVPHLGRADVDWAAKGEEYADRILATAQAGQPLEELRETLMDLLEPVLVQLIRIDFGTSCCNGNRPAVITVRVGNNYDSLGQMLALAAALIIAGFVAYLGWIIVSHWSLLSG